MIIKLFKKEPKIIEGYKINTFVVSEILSQKITLREAKEIVDKIRKRGIRK